MEATMFSGWIYDHLKPHAAALKVAHPLMLRAIAAHRGVRMPSFFGFLLMMAMWLSGGYPGPHAAFWQYWGASLDWSILALGFVVLMLGSPEDVWAIRLGRTRSRI